MSDPKIRASLLIKFNKALAECEVPPKEGVNPRFPTKRYVMLDDAVLCIKAACKKAGLTFSTIVSYDDTHNSVVVLNVFRDAEGNELDFGHQYFPCGEKTPQGIGSAITYARRYSVIPLFNFSEDDDDGEEAMGTARHGRQVASIPGARSAHEPEDGPPEALRPRPGLEGSRTGARRVLTPARPVEPAKPKAPQKSTYSEEEIEWAKLTQTLKGVAMGNLTTDQLQYMTGSWASYVKQGEATGRRMEAMASIRAACILLGLQIPMECDDLP